MFLLQSLKELNKIDKEIKNLDLDILDEIKHPIIKHSLYHRCIYANLVLDNINLSSIDSNGMDILIKEISKIAKLNSFSYLSKFSYEEEKVYIIDNFMAYMSLLDAFFIAKKLNLKVLLCNKFLSEKELLIALDLAEKIHLKDTIKILQTFKKTKFIDLEILKYYYNLAEINICEDKIIIKNLNDSINNKIELHFNDNRNITKCDIYSSKGRKRILIECSNGYDNEFIIKSYDYTDLNVKIKFFSKNNFSISKCYSTFEDIAKEAASYISLLYGAIS